MFPGLSRAVRPNVPRPLLFVHEWSSPWTEMAPVGRPGRTGASLSHAHLLASAICSFCKMGTDELRTRVPLIIRDPRNPQSHGRVFREPTEIVNVYPTLVDLATGSPPDYDVDGVSLGPLIRNPDGPMPTPQGFHTPLAFSVYPRCLNSDSYPVPQGYNVTENACVGVADHDFTHMGLAVRSKQWRYVEWRHWDGRRLAPDFSREPAQIELYNHTADMGTSFDHNYERFNDYGTPGTEAVVAQHAAWVRQQWSR